MDSNAVGNIFFNIIKTKCITLKKKYVCMRRKWTGGCEEYTVKKVATIHNPVPYPVNIPSH